MQTPVASQPAAGADTVCGIMVLDPSVCFGRNTTAKQVIQARVSPEAIGRWPLCHIQVFVHKAWTTSWVMWHLQIWAWQWSEQRYNSGT